MHQLIMHNGQLGPVERCLSPAQAGLLTGWGVFSTLRVYSGVPAYFELHWERLTRDAGRIEVQVPCDASEMRRDLMTLVKANRALDAAARIFLVRNQADEEGMWSETAGRPTDVLILTAPLRNWPSSVRLNITPHGRNTTDPLVGTKILSWVNNVGRLEEMQKQGFDETVLLNERDEAAECTSANIFAIRGEDLLTPPLDSGCLAGVTRTLILRVAPEAGLRPLEQALRPEDLCSADELFISSSTRELIPVRELGSYSLASSWPKTERLHASYREAVRRYVAAAGELTADLTTDKDG